MPWGWLKDKLKDVAEETWEAVTTVADEVVETVGEAAAASGDVIGAAGQVIDVATLGAASTVMHAVDNTVLDGLDEVTGGVIDIDYDGGNISAGVGIKGVAHMGAALGEDGARHSAETFNQGFDVALSDNGLEASGQAGINWGPLPYAAGDVEIAPTGDITFEGEVQGTIPTPYGLLSGEAQAEFERHGDEWGGSFSGDGSLLLTNGNTVTGGLDVAYAQTADGSMLSLGVEGSYTVPGTGTVGGSLGYDRLEIGDTVATQFEAGGYATGFGGHVEAGVSHTSVAGPDGSYSEWDAGGSVTGYGAHVEAGVSHTSVTTPDGSYSEWDTGGGVAVQGIGDVVGDTNWTPQETTSYEEPVAAPEAPAEFEQAIEAADEVESSVDDLFSDLG